MQVSRMQSSSTNSMRAGVACCAIGLSLLLSGCLIAPRTYVEPAPKARQSASPPARAVTPGPKPGSVYTVRAGDTLYAIAFKHGLDYRELARWNALLDPSRILVGQILRLTAPTTSSLAGSPAPGSQSRPVPAAPKPTAPTAPTASKPPAPLPAPGTASRPSTVSEAIGRPSGSAVATTTGPVIRPPDPTAGPSTTPLAETPIPAEPVPLASGSGSNAMPRSAATPTPASGTTLPATTSQNAGPGAGAAYPNATPNAPPAPSMPISAPPGPATTTTSAVSPSVAANSGATANPLPPSTAVAAPSPPPPINPNAPSKQVSGIRWRWPTEGKLVGRFVAGDPTESGIEIAGRLGQTITASADGEVVYSGNGLLGYGELIIIQHSPDFLSAYGHNQKRLVTEGTKVKAGQAIAEMGRQAGVDLLHFEIRQSGKPVDPMKFLP